jgi:putative ABC transport system permease protein
MEIRPILSALTRNSAGAVLVSVQIAITLAIVVNAVFLVTKRIETVSRPTGLDEYNMFAFWTNGFGKDFNFHASVRDDMNLLRHLPGVVAAAPTPQVPLSGSGSSNCMYPLPNEKGTCQPVAYYEMDEYGLSALGATLSEGKYFEPETIEWRTKVAQDPPKSGQVVVSKTFAEKLFPGATSFVGKTIYDNQSHPERIVGVIGHIQGSWVGWDKLEHVMLRPMVGPGSSIQYLVRTKPGEIDRVMADTEAALKKSNKFRVVGKLNKVSEMKERSYSGDTMMVVILGTVTGLVVVFSCLGIFGLATFNVNTRTRQIGTRRAVGARKLDIMRYFLVENWLVTTAGVVVGCALALIAGHYLATHYGLAQLDLYYLVGGVLGLWAVGQLAAWQPSLRAAKVSPAMATRNV